MWTMTLRILSLAGTIVPRAHPEGTRTGYEQRLIVRCEAKSVAYTTPWYVSCSAYAPVTRVAVGRGGGVVSLSVLAGRGRGGEAIDR
jgi:hypothetical protein